MVCSSLGDGWRNVRMHEEEDLAQQSHSEARKSAKFRRRQKNVTKDGVGVYVTEDGVGVYVTKDGVGVHMTKDGVGVHIAHVGNAWQAHWQTFGHGVTDGGGVGHGGGEYGVQLKAGEWVKEKEGGG
jgi:hypothetical protein